MVTSQIHHIFPQDSLKGTYVSPTYGGGAKSLSEHIAIIDALNGKKNTFNKDQKSNLVDLFTNKENSKLAASVDEVNGIFSKSGFGFFHHNTNHNGYNDL